MITVVVGKEIEKIKGDFESYLNGLNMVGEISYSQYSELYDEGTKQIQRAYELGKTELEKENAELKDKLNNLASVAEVRLANWQKYEKENAEQEELLNSNLAENKEIYKKMVDLDTALEDCTESLTDARIKIKELEEKISNLLSCKNCPENKGGYICQKEYEDKCLAQKIQYIKELQEENAEQKKKIENLQKYLDAQNCYRECAETWMKLTKAKEIIKYLCSMVRELNKPNVQLTDVDYSLKEAEQFLKESEDEKCQS